MIHRISGWSFTWGGALKTNADVFRAVYGAIHAVAEGGGEERRAVSRAVIQTVAGAMSQALGDVYHLDGGGPMKYKGRGLFVDPEGYARDHGAMA